MATYNVCKHVRLINNVFLRVSGYRDSFRAVANKAISPKRYKGQGNVDGSGQLTYDALRQFRHEQAKCSMLIQHTSPAELALEMARKHGQIVSAHVFCRDADRGETKHFLLVEYRNVASVKSMMSSAKQFPNNLHIPIETRFLFCRYPSDRRHKDNVVTKDIRPVFVENYGTCSLSSADLMNCSSLDGQMSLLYENQSLSELDIRLRYFLCSEIEAVIRKMYPYAVAQPFGSSVNGFGRFNCDLDIVLDLWGAKQNMDADEAVMRRHGGMYFMTKMRSDNERLLAQNSLDFIAGLIYNIVPQMVNVRRILKARIPIVKFLHSSSGIDCDLCVDNRPAQAMSELLYYLSVWEHASHHTPALVFAIRQWARSAGVTRANPGHWMSNFMLTLLTVHFLQTRSRPILPSLKSLKLAPGPAKILSPDISLPINAVKESAAHDPQQLGDLLLEFFQYYTNFDFTNAGISVIEGSTVTKPDASVPLYIENPLERELNVAKNVQSVYLQEFQSACQSAYRCLEQSSTPASSKPWGLLNILQVGGDSDESNDVAYSEGGDSWAAETAEKDSSAASNVSDFSASSGFERSRLNFRVAEIFNESDSTVSESVLHKLH